MPVLGELPVGADEVPRGLAEQLARPARLLLQPDAVAAAEPVLRDRVDRRSQADVEVEGADGGKRQLPLDTGELGELPALGLLAPAAAPCADGLLDRGGPGRARQSRVTFVTVQSASAPR